MVRKHRQWPSGGIIIIMAYFRPFVTVSVHHPPTEEQATTEAGQAILYQVRPSFTCNIIEPFRQNHLSLSKRERTLLCKYLVSSVTWYYCERSELLIRQVYQFELGCIKKIAH